MCDVSVSALHVVGNLRKAPDPAPRLGEGSGRTRGCWQKPLQTPHPNCCSYDSDSELASLLWGRAEPPGAWDGAGEKAGTVGDPWWGTGEPSAKSEVAVTQKPPAPTPASPSCEGGRAQGPGPERSAGVAPPTQPPALCSELPWEPDAALGHTPDVRVLCRVCCRNRWNQFRSHVLLQDPWPWGLRAHSSSAGGRPGAGGVMAGGPPRHTAGRGPSTAKSASKADDASAALREWAGAGRLHWAMAGLGALGTGRWPW